jgi:hypothetical protein
VQVPMDLRSEREREQEADLFVLSLPLPLLLALMVVLVVPVGGWWRTNHCPSGREFLWSKAHRLGHMFLSRGRDL